jgi:hypothetical protein
MHVRLAPSHACLSSTPHLGPIPPWTLSSTLLRRPPRMSQSIDCHATNEQNTTCLGT